MEGLQEILAVLENGARVGFFCAVALIPILTVLKWFGR